MSINLKHTIYLSLATLTLFAVGNPVVNAAKTNQSNSEKQTSQSSQSSNKKYNSNKTQTSSSKNSSKSKTSDKNATSRTSDSSSSIKQDKNSSKTSTSKTEHSKSSNNKKSKQTSKVSIVSNKKVPNQKYDNVLTGKNPIFDQPGSISGAKVILNKSAIKKLINQKVTFMTYRVAKTSNGLTYYKIVSQNHSVRGWIYAKGINEVHNSNSSSKKRGKKANTEKTLMKRINGLISDAISLASQAQSASNSNDNDSSNSLMQSANQKISDAQAAAKKLKVNNDKDSVSLNISRATADIQKIQDSIQNSSNVSDQNYLNSANNFVNTAYNALGKVKSNMKNSSISQLDTANQIVLAQNALQSATNAVNQIRDTNTKSSATSQINGAVDYMTTLSNDAKASGVDTPTSIPSNDTIRYSLITHYVDKAHFYIDDIKNNQLTASLNNKTRVTNDVSNAKASLQVAYNLMLSLQDSSLNTSANQLISNAISYIQENSVMSSSATSSASTSSSSSSNANSSSSSSASSSSSSSNTNNSSYLSGNHTISK